jgi:predicted nucleic acid-binding protein
MRAFIDSNVAVYRFSEYDDHRQAIAERLMEDHDASNQLVVSTQVLLETYNTLVKKKRVRPKLALAAVQALSRYEVVSPSHQSAMVAAELAAQHSISVWDAFIVQAALEAGCEVLYSEDLQAGRRFSGSRGALEVVNPFSGASAHEPAPGYAVQSAAKPKSSKPPARPAKTGPRKPAAPAAPSPRRRG